MNYYAVSFKIECDDALLQPSRELLADAVAEAGFESFEDTQEGLTGYVQVDLFDENILKKAIADFPIGEAKIAYTVSKAEQKDWNEAWEQEGFDPIFIEDQCVIYDARQQGNTPLSSLIAPLRIGIEAQMAFGTGTHNTTRMVVAALLKSDLKGKRVLDCGCGTGILSIVAAKCGAKDVVAYDIDEWSVENTQHNAELNNVELEVLEGDKNALTHVNGLFDVVMANINRNILLDDMQAYEDVMQHDGIMILSGFYEQDAPILLERAEELGLKEKMRLISGDWCCLVLSH